MAEEEYIFSNEYRIEDPGLGISYCGSAADVERKRERYPDGALRREVCYRKGILHGPAVFWSPLGQMLACTWFVEGERTGKSRQWYADGVLASLQIFVGGRLHGPQEYYFPDGKIKSRISYEYGKLHGLAVLYDVAGKEKKKVRYQFGAIGS